MALMVDGEEPQQGAKLSRGSRLLTWNKIDPGRDK